jgi:CHAT domain-containing protein
MPSASMLAALRDQLEGRPPAEGLLAVLADPVFELDDPRVRGLPSSTASGTRVRGRLKPAPRHFERLAFSRFEADRILALVPPAESFKATGFDADRTVVISGRLSGYRLLHFATHGELNTEYPELSRLVLSRVDAQGEPRADDSIFAHEIYDLDLPADLVVLSACETALGAEIRGEGLLGLTQGFFYAGAARVLVSLWKVDDEATAELMAHFYESLLARGQQPARALREAQAAIRGQKRWRAPYYWAGFVLFGEWR